MTWLLRLEGQPAEIWEPEIEVARQNYRLLAEQAAARGDAGALQRNQQDLDPPTACADGAWRPPRACRSPVSEKAARAAAVAAMLRQKT